MKYFLICSLFLVSIQSGNVLKPNRPPKGFVFIPAGVVEVHGQKQAMPAFLMSEMEVTNAQYHAFLEDLKIQGQDSLYCLAYPDTAAWEIENWLMEPLANLYFWHPAYADYPVVNISEQGANGYCKWLENQLKETYSDQIKAVHLPHKIEWIYAAQAGNNSAVYPWGNVNPIGTSGDCRANFRVIGEQNISSAENGPTIIGDSTFLSNTFLNETDITAPSRSFAPNPWGLYNMSGNVAELTQEGVAMGGSWYSTGYDIRVTSEVPFEKPNPFVGFRPIIYLK